MSLETEAGGAFAEQPPLARPLRNFWYLAVRGSRIKPGTTRAMTLLGEAVLIGRRRTGEVFAFAERCPHRGMPLRHAGFAKDTLQCCFHGWKFDVTDGRCIEIPGLAFEQQIDTRRFALRAYPCREVQGNVWVFVPALGDGAGQDDPKPAIPEVPDFGDQPPRVAATMRFSCPVDQAVIGFFDPTHPPFVHTSRWWKSRKADLHPKEKHYEPTSLGFKMTRHALENGALPYRLLGRNPMIEIALELPGIRIEHIAGARHSVCVLAAATPIDDATTDVHYCIYWTPRWLAPLQPLAWCFTRTFLRQDRDVADKLDSKGNDQRPLLVGDPDAQIKWYYRLKAAYQRAQASRQPFINPLQPRTLRWRS